MVQTNRYNPYDKRDKCDNFNKRYAAPPKKKKQKEPEKTPALASAVIFK